MKHVNHNNKEYDYTPELMKNIFNFGIDNGRETEYFNEVFLKGIEFKSESYENWSKNMNIFIECNQLDGSRASGIETTTCSLWIHALYGEDGKLFQAFHIPIQDLWDLIMETGCRKTKSFHKTSTGNVTEGYLIPIDKVVNKLNPIKKYIEEHARTETNFRK